MMLEAICNAHEEGKSESASGMDRRIGGDGLICVAIGKWPELTPIRSDDCAP